MKTRNQYKVAEWLGIGPGTLSNIFCGNRRPGRNLALKLASVSGVSFEDWMLADTQHLKKKVFIAWTINNEMER